MLGNLVGAQIWKQFALINTSYWTWSWVWNNSAWIMNEQTLTYRSWERQKYMLFKSSILSLHVESFFSLLRDRSAHSISITSMNSTKGVMIVIPSRPYSLLKYLCLCIYYKFEKHYEAGNVLEFWTCIVFIYCVL